jgi:chloramphenicol-sensitive protein RarD
VERVGHRHESLLRLGGTPGKAYLIGPVNPRNPESRSGMIFALTAYGLWGLLPIYWKALHGIPLGEVLAHRVLWSAATVLLLLAAIRRMPDFLRVLRDPRRRLLLGVSAVLIGCNWSIYILAVYRGELLQASLGYYILPLMSVGLGVAVLRERLSRIQIAAVALAALGVLILGMQHKGLPWVALSLALTFTLYGYMKKRLAVESLTGLAIETLWLSPVAAGYLAWLSWRHVPQAFAVSTGSTVLLMGAGAITLAPLFFFGVAARRLPLSTLGFYQYLSPSIQLLMAVLWFHEPFTRLHGMAFGLIWAALALYTVDAIRKA